MAGTGVLIIAHGSKDREWVGMIEQAVKAAELDLPYVTGFLELVPGKSIKDGIRGLESRDLDRILVIPLFLTMSSTHLHEIQYALGLIPRSTIPTDIELIQPHAKIIWCSPLESHPYVHAILEERIKCLSQTPSQEALLLIGHGSDVEGFHEGWEELLNNISTDIHKRFGFVQTSYASLHPDNIQERAEVLAAKGKLIVIPFFLSEGYFTKSVLPRRLEGVEHLYQGQSLLPHFLVAQWIKDSVQRTVREVDISDKDVDDSKSLLYTLNH